MAVVSCNKFTNFLVSQTPIYDKLIIRDIRPEDSWIGTVETGQFEPFSDVEHSFDRFRSVFPNLTKEWVRTQNGSCIGTPCDKKEHRIGWGSDRVTYFLEEQSWATDLLCFDQMMHITHAKEHFSQIISDILRPATAWIMSHFLRKRAAQHAGKKWLAKAGQPDFSYSWEKVGDEEIYINTSGEPTSKLTPQMLQRRVHPLFLKGYVGKSPFSDMPPLIELVTDMETIWELDKQANLPAGGIATQWRFTDWGAANKYWKYAFVGQLGNYVIRGDPFPLRFNKVSTNKFQVVYPYENGAATQGIGSNENPDYQNAQYQFSIIWHRRALRALVAEPASVNSQLPFASRNFGGKWQFVMNDLGVDQNGCVIENKRGNKGQFIADFKLAIKPQYVEFAELIFHKREPACITEIATCNTDPGYPVQSYYSENSACPETATLVFTPSKKASTGTYEIAANTITCNGVPIVHPAISGSSTLAALVTELQADIGILGTWSVVSGSTTQIQLAGSTCSAVTLPFQA